MFIVILIALLVERFFDWSHLRQWDWYTGLERMAAQKLPGASPYLVLGGVIVPSLLVLRILQSLLSRSIFGLGWFLLSLLVVLYCFGPKNLWADAFASISSLTSQGAEKSAETLQSTFNVNTANATESVQQQLTNQIIIAANQRVFAIVFWYLLLGLPGALCYRLANVSAHNSEMPDVSKAARQLQDAMDWLSVRALTFIFAIGGNFTRVLTCWRQRLTMGLDGNDIIMTECGLAAITGDNEKMPEDGALEKSAVSLLDRAFIITLIILFVLLLVAHV